MEFSAVNRRRPSCEAPLGPGAKKGGCFRRLIFCRRTADFLSGLIGLKFVGTSACRTLADFLSRLTAFRLVERVDLRHVGKDACSRDISMRRENQTIVGKRPWTPWDTCVI